jgi:hypothetical protein
VEVVELLPRLWRWSLPHPEWEPDDAEDGEGWQREVASYALVADDELVLFDPLVPPAGSEDANRFEALLLTHGDAILDDARGALERALRQ